MIVIFLKSWLEIWKISDFNKSYFSQVSRSWIPGLMQMYERFQAETILQELWKGRDSSRTQEYEDLKDCFVKENRDLSMFVDQMEDAS